MCGPLGWPDEEEEEQLVQLKDFHSIGKLGPILVMDRVVPELVQPLQLGRKGRISPYHVMVGRYFYFVAPGNFSPLNLLIVFI